MNSANLEKLDETWPVPVAGLVPFSTVDFPDHLSCVFFLQGCTFECVYCHNKHLIPFKSAGLIASHQIHEFLQSRRGKLDAVVFSGGEPTAHPGLRDALKLAQDLGYKCALHTSGAHPERLVSSLPYLSWIGLDIKAPFANYSTITKNTFATSKVIRSLEAVVASGIKYEVRTTVDPRYFNREWLIELASDVSKLGVKRIVLQQCRLHAGRDNLSRDKSTSLDEFFESDGLRSELKAFLEEVELRGG